ncbi:unnamed protein product [Anisakis simplex]|uniref:C2H2-type domain-containing protein n=1 Tax=Anisakis simplex TaxID=6269 RepID=A0A0M3K168_ANISI|nr:unnamed protein product [Anisakis simplex]
MAGMEVNFRCELDERQREQLEPFEGYLRARDAVGVPCSNLLQVLAALMYVPPAEEIAKFVSRKWLTLQAYDPDRLGRDRHVRLAQRGACTTLVLEAVCLLKGVQLVVHDLGGSGESEAYGGSGPIFWGLEYRGRYCAVRVGPAKRVRRPIGPVQQGRTWGTSRPAQPGRGRCSHQSAPGKTGGGGPMWGRAIPGGRAAAAVSHGRGVIHDHGYRRNQPAVEPAEARPQPPEFRPANVSGLRAEAAAELTEPAQPAYVIEDGSIFCRLHGCARPDTGFKTVAAWRLHVRRAGCHQQLAFCASCGHEVGVPHGLSPADHQVHMDAHRRERCVGASKAVKRWRLMAAAELRVLNRDNSFIEVGHGAEAPLPQVQRKRRLSTEAERRAEVCMTFLKRFKDAEPAKYKSLAAELHARNL